MQKLRAFFFFFFSAKILAYDQRLNDTLTNDIVSFEQLGPDLFKRHLNNTEFKNNFKKLLMSI